MSPVASRAGVTSGGRFVRPTEKKAGADIASTTKTATFTSPAFNIEDALQVDALLTVTAASGTSPTLQWKLQCSQDGTTWYDAQPNALPNLTAAGSQAASFAANGNQGRWVFTIGGTTPSFTFNVDTQAVVR
jgi:hypothetical protein